MSEPVQVLTDPALLPLIRESLLNQKAVGDGLAAQTSQLSRQAAAMEGQSASMQRQADYLVGARPMSLLDRRDELVRLVLACAARATSGGMYTYFNAQAVVQDAVALQMEIDNRMSQVNTPG